MQRRYEERLPTLIWHKACSHRVILLQNPKPNPSPLYAESDFLHTLCSHQNAEAARDAVKSKPAAKTQDTFPSQHLCSLHPQGSENKDRERCLWKQHWDILHLYHRSWRENKYHREETDIINLLQAPTLRIFCKLDYLAWVPHANSLDPPHLSSPSPLLPLFLFVSSQMLWRWFMHFLIKSCTKTQGYLMELQTFQDMK